jgi:hypothetical protein
MQKWLIIIIGVILLVGILFYLKYSRITRLKRRYMQLTHQSPQIAYESLQWQLNKLKTKTPGKTEEWYLEKIIFDLERDMR